MYRVILGAFKLEYNAVIVKKESGKKGIDTIIYPHNGRYFVVAGSFELEKSANARLIQVKDAGYVFSYVKKYC